MVPQTCAAVYINGSKMAEFGIGLTADSLCGSKGTSGRIYLFYTQDTTIFADTNAFLLAPWFFIPCHTKRKDQTVYTKRKHITHFDPNTPLLLRVVVATLMFRERLNCPWTKHRGNCLRGRSLSQAKISPAAETETGNCPGYCSWCSKRQMAPAL